ncbi:hypothetical protein BDD12DRAFT_194959 [Trichophaea hybrida]|nr:hypothetical protein BDD12DRAFT_194959 [Trichophaea hybrida]
MDLHTDRNYYGMQLRSTALHPVLHTNRVMDAIAFQAGGKMLWLMGMLGLCCGPMLPRDMDPLRHFHLQQSKSLFLFAGRNWTDKTDQRIYATELRPASYQLLWWESCTSHRSWMKRQWHSRRTHWCYPKRRNKRGHSGFAECFLTFSLYFLELNTIELSIMTTLKAKSFWEEVEMYNYYALLRIKERHWKSLLLNSCKQFCAGFPI